MKFEPFHTGLLGRPKVIAVDMIQYPGLWGICLSHHMPNNNHPRYAADTTTEGTLRFLEAVRDGRDGIDMESLADYTVTTHHVDADAVLPVWSLLNPEAALVRRPLLEQVARCGDFFLYLDEASAKINATIEGLHLRLRGTGKAGDRLVDARLTSACFDWLLPRMEYLLDAPDDYREYWEAPLHNLRVDMDYLQHPGSVMECWDRHLSLVETNHDTEVHALNTVCRNDLLLVWRTDCPARRLEVRPAIAWYELTSLPHRPRYDLADLAERLNRAECASSESPVWIYQSAPITVDAECSRLGQQVVLEVVAEWFGAHSEDQIPAAYRADVSEVFRFQPRHAVWESDRRFAECPEVSFHPGAPHRGLHFLGAKGARSDGQTLLATGKYPLPFAVADDFYWNSAADEALQLEVTYQDCGAGTFAVQYDAWSDPCRATPAVTLIGDGQTKTARFTLCDPRLGASGEQGADLCLVRSPGTPFALTELRLRKGDRS